MFVVKLDSIQSIQDRNMIYDLSSAEVEQNTINSTTELYSHVIKHAATRQRVKTNDAIEQLKCTLFSWC